MINEYEVNSNTLALLPVGTNVTKVIEKQDSFLVNQTPSQIIDYSCRSFGSSYLGRHEGTKHLTGINYKAPIIIEESKSEKTFMFDTKDIEIFITNTVKYIIKDLEILGIEMRK